jgi:hypothetical protein
MGAAGLTRPLLHRRRKVPAGISIAEGYDTRKYLGGRGCRRWAGFDPELTVVTVRYREVIPAPSCVLRQICRSLKGSTSRRRADTNQIHGARVPNVLSGGELITETAGMEILVKRETREH